MDNDDQPIGTVLSRRDVLKLLGLGSAAALMASCAPGMIETITPIATDISATSIKAPISTTATSVSIPVPACVVRPEMTEGPYADIDLVRTRDAGVEIRLAERVEDRHLARVKRFVPSAVSELPHAALGSEGGGSVPVDPTDAEGVRTIQRVFQVDLSVSGEAGLVHAGERVHVRFSHGWSPLSDQWYRQIRQLFLSRFTV